MKQYLIRCIATGEFIRLCSGKNSWSTAGSAKGAYNTSGTWGKGGVHHFGKFDDQSIYEIVEFTLCEAGALEEAKALLKRAACLSGLDDEYFQLYSDIMHFIKENK